ncbi:MAG: hypothetical protein N4A72_21050 [Bacteroidales bacterium]|jgi:hypothetical protein|nr:hypothetical protein [Bacteroidales bacterium]
MIFPKTPLDIKSGIETSVNKYNSIGDLRVRQFIKLLAKVPDELIIEGVVLLIEDDNNGFQEQEIACRILTEIKPKSALNLYELVTRIISNWNKSCEEIVFWFALNYGTGKVKTCFNSIEYQLNSEPELDKLNTMKRWLRVLEK